MIKHNYKLSIKMIDYSGLKKECIFSEEEEEEEEEEK